MSIFAGVELFEGLGGEEIQAIEEVSVHRKFSKNTVIINEDDNADSLYVIESGKVKVFLSDKGGKEYVINTMGEGEYFGELALLDDEKRSASVMTLDNASFYIIYKNDFKELLERYPSISITLLKNLTRQVRHITENVKSLALKDVYGRLVKVITELAEPRGNDEYIVSERLTQQDIADRVGASREMVARILKDLTTGNYISFDKRYIVIHGKLPTAY